MTALSWILIALLVASMVITAIVCINNKNLKAIVEDLEERTKDLTKNYEATAIELQNFKDRVVVLHDMKPKSKKSNASALQLSNEIIPYITEENDQITITVLKA